MDNKKVEIEEEMIEIDIFSIMLFLKKNIKLIFISTIICAIILFLLSTLFVTKKYSSEARIYLVPNVSDQGIVDYNAVTSNSKMVNNYISMLKGETILSKVAANLDIDNVETIKKSLSVSNETNTEIISVKAITENPSKSKEIASTTINVFFKEMKDKLDIKNMTTLDEPKINNIPVSPNKKIYIILGMIIGLIGSMFYIILKFIFDKRLKTKSEAESFLGVPVLGEIPWFEE